MNFEKIHGRNITGLAYLGFVTNPILLKIKETLEEIPLGIDEQLKQNYLKQTFEDKLKKVLLVKVPESLKNRNYKIPFYCEILQEDFSEELVGRIESIKWYVDSNGTFYVQFIFLKVVS